MSYYYTKFHSPNFDDWLLPSDRIDNHKFQATTVTLSVASRLKSFTIFIPCRMSDFLLKLSYVK
jgi:hypothetical protein